MALGGLRGHFAIIAQHILVCNSVYEAREEKLIEEKLL